MGSTYIFAMEHFVKSAFFNFRLHFDSNRSAKHADLTRSHRDRQNEPFPTSIAHIHVKLSLPTKIQGDAATASVQKFRLS